MKKTWYFTMVAISLLTFACQGAWGEGLNIVYTANTRGEVKPVTV